MDFSDLKVKYANVEGRAKRLMSAISAELNHLLVKEGVTLGVPIESRVKEWVSVEEKINRNSLAMEDVEELEDLVGVRLILLFRRDVETVDSLLRSVLVINSSEDTSLRLADAQFGYQSQHYIVEIPQAWLKIPTWGELGGIRVEIQVRTLAQHIWAAASHKLQYKHEASVPLPLRRAINRASALLETVDIEFDRLLADRLAYVEDEMNLKDDDAILNVDVLQSVLSSVFPAKNKHRNENYDELLMDLNNFGVKTSGDLERMLRKHFKAVMSSEAKEVRERTQIDMYFKHVGLARLALRKEFGDDPVLDYMKARSAS